MTTVVIVGGGIAGLAAAYALRDEPVDVVVVEAASRLGGKLAVSDIAGVPVDSGAEAMLARRPEGIELAKLLGLELVHPATTTASLYIDGALKPVPKGTMMGVPTSAEAVRNVVSAETQSRIDAEPDVPGEPIADDRSVAEAIAPRLGSEVVARLVEPLLGGVYAGRADVLSLSATMPGLAARLRNSPSVVAAARASTGTPTPGPVFATLPDGLGSLPHALASASGADIRLGVTVREIRLQDNGFRLLTGPVPDTEVIDADAVIVAVPAAKAARMLTDAAPQAARELTQIEYASTALVTLAYRGAALPAGSGVLVPATEGRAVKALTFSSQKWAHLDGDVQIVRASLGRHRDEQVLHRDDNELAFLAAQEVSAIVGSTLVPIETRVTRWGGALPQYAVGHLERVRRIRDDVAHVAGLAVCGAAYDGVGVPACIASGQQAAAAILAALRSRHG